MRLRPRAVVLSLILAVVVNALGLLFLLRINDHVRPAKGRAQVEARPIDFTARKKRKPPRRRVRRRIKRVALRQPPLPVPNLPSSIQAPGLLLPDVAAASLIRPVFDEEMASNTRLILAEEEVDEPPKVVHRVAPEYPEEAADKGVTGWVQLKLLIDRQGRVERVLLSNSQPKKTFDRVARRAIKRWVFSPARYQGKSVAVWFRQRLIFNLQ